MAVAARASLRLLGGQRVAVRGARRAQLAAAGRGWSRQLRHWHSRGLVVRAEETQTSRESNGDKETEKAVRLATQRLESLLAGAGDGEVEFMNKAMREVAPGYKAAAYCVAGGVVGTVAVCLCNLLELDPYGGMDLSLGTLQAALWGVLFAPPVMATLYMKWSPSVSKQYPALTTLREVKEEEEGSLYCGMTDAQLAGITLTAAFAACVFELALVQGILQRLDTDMLSFLGTQDAARAGVVLALLTGVLGRGVLEAAAFEAETEEMEVVSNALENCDRYYTVMDANKDTAREMSAAFKTVAFVWFQQKKKAQGWAFWSSAFNIAYLIMLWRLTGNLASPIVALALATSVDVREYKKRHPEEFDQQE